MRVVLVFLCTIISVQVQAQWVEKYQTFSTSFGELHMQNDSVFFINGRTNSFLKTEDAFETTEVVFIDLDGFFTNSEIRFINKSKGYFLTLANNLLLTDDGGETWKLKSFTDYPQPFNPRYIIPQNKDTLFLLGGGLAKSVDGGETWTNRIDSSLYTSSLAEELMDSLLSNLDFISDLNQCFLISYSESLTEHYSRNCGESGRSVIIPEEHSGFKSFYINNETIYLLYSPRGPGSKIQKSSDYGLSWSEINLPGEYAYNKINGINQDTVFVIGSDGSLIQSFDGFDSYEVEHLNTDQTLHDLVITSRKEAFITSTRFIFKKEDISIPTNNEWDTKPIGIRLNQNYPNPFNPSTNISFSLSKPQDIEISIYDLLGRKVEVVFKGDKLSGDHTINFNARNLSSGIYFYELKVGDFTERKKMTLVK